MTEGRTSLTRLRGVRVHNLKEIDLDLPRGKLIVLTGVSGSGKSSLAFDTLYAEGQRRYIETFSAYTRQYLDVLEKPDADLIEGILPAIAVGQEIGWRGGRSTVGSVTEIQEHLALLYAREGEVWCPLCGLEVKPADVDQVLRAIEEMRSGEKYQVGFPVANGSSLQVGDRQRRLREEGFVRVRIDGKPVTLSGVDEEITESNRLDVIVDRLVKGREDEGRLRDSIETAFRYGEGRCLLLWGENERTFDRRWRCGGCGREYVKPDPRLFRPNSALGACPSCEGFGRLLDLDMDKIVPDRSKCLRDGAIVPWTTPAYRDWEEELLSAAAKKGVPCDRPFKYLNAEEVLWIENGDGEFGGLKGFFQWLERKIYRTHVRVFLSRWRAFRPCPACGGARLRPEALAVRVTGINLGELMRLSVREARERLSGFGKVEGKPIGQRVLGEVLGRLGYLDRVGLGYLELDRPARTLAVGEARRVSLASALGSGLVNVLYVLDEPTAGLQRRDVTRLVEAIQRLRDAGNTVVVVEHDRAVIEAADWVVDLGPMAGERGGHVVYSGPPEGLRQCPESLTGQYLSGKRTITAGWSQRRDAKGWIELKGAKGRNLKDIDVSFPLGVLCVVTGVSGSGKRSLVEETLYPALLKRVRGEHLPGEPYRQLKGAQELDDVVLVDATGLARSARSNPATYIRVFQEIRRTFASTHEARLRNFGPGKFSFNIAGGRCSACEGNGYKEVDLQFLPPVMVKCAECQGKRFRPEVLEVTYRGRNIAEVLEMTAREAFGYFRNRPKVQSRLRPLFEVGLDYLRLGQPTSTLSGGEAQRLKLASYMANEVSRATRIAGPGKRILFLMIEPTTGLHPADVTVLLEALHKLVDAGHSLVVVEHNVEVATSADWIIELGPGAGAEGGLIVAQGSPEALAKQQTAAGEEVAHCLLLQKSSQRRKPGETRAPSAPEETET